MRVSGLLQRSGLEAPLHPAHAFDDVAAPWTTAPANAPGVRSFARTAIHFARGAVFFSLTVLDRFGITSGSTAVDAALFALYFFLAVGLLFDGLALSTTRVQIFAAVVAAAVTSWWLNRSGGAGPSTLSLLLFLAMYAPFVFTIRPDVDDPDDGTAPATQFLAFALLCAVAGILQFYLQFVIHASWLFDFTPAIPPSLRCTTGFNTVISAGRFVKSNGFFLREPSGFSFMMALAFVMEWSLRRRLLWLACFGMGLLLSYSGTGLLTIAIALLVPFDRRAILRLVGAACAATVVFLVVGEALNLTFTVDRLNEFGSERSSAYIRYVAPFRLVSDTFNDAAWTPFFGHGPGSIKHLLLAYRSHDPTWAKLVFEYGLVGFVSLCALYLVVLHHPGVPLRWRVVLFISWLVMGGHLLSPDANALRLCIVGFLPPLLRGRTEALRKEGPGVATPRPLRGSS
ncbi:MAG TPA: hypothetical protein VK841_06695 [Polyangiaceae bacterium]|nr:hypothetical protein [Polyangiaceae bacterium]